MRRVKPCRTASIEHMLIIRKQYGSEQIKVNQDNSINVPINR